MCTSIFKDSVFQTLHSPLPRNKKTLKYLLSYFLSEIKRIIKLKYTLKYRVDFLKFALKLGGIISLVFNFGERK